MQVNCDEYAQDYVHGNIFPSEGTLRNLLECKGKNDFNDQNNNINARNYTGKKKVWLMQYFFIVQRSNENLVVGT